MFKWGFDLTDFGSSQNFEKVLRANKLSSGYKLVKKRGERFFTWKNSSVKLITNNNPLTGEYSSGGRTKEHGYASYIGITGEKEAVIKLVKTIKKYAVYIKDESPNERDYI